VRVYLHPDLQLSGCLLTDTALGTQYTVTADTAWLLRSVAKDGRVDSIVQAATRHYGISRDEAVRSLYAVIGFLDSIGGVVIYETGIAASVLLFINRSGRRRYMPSFSGYWRMTAQAYGFIMLVLTAVLLVLAVIAHVPLYCSLLPVLVIASCAIHEAGHIICIHRFGISSYLLAGIGYAAVAYVGARMRQERIIAASGPGIAVVVYLAIAVIANNPLLHYVCIAIAAVHSMSLLPLFADGKTLWRKQ